MGLDPTLHHACESLTRISPFQALHGRDPQLPLDIKVELPNKNTQANAMDWWLHLQQIQPILRLSIHKNLQLAQPRQKRCYDKGHREIEYAAGAKVLVYFPIRRWRLGGSIMHRWIDPFTLIQSMRTNTYSLRRDANGRMTYVHVMRMKPYVKHSIDTTQLKHHKKKQLTMMSPTMTNQKALQSQPTSRMKQSCHWTRATGMQSVMATHQM